MFSTHQNDESTFTLFGEDSVFAPRTKRLMPIPIQDQNFATYLGPNLTRSFEAIIKPSTCEYTILEVDRFSGSFGIGYPVLGRGKGRD